MGTPSHSELQTTSVRLDHRGATTTTHHQAFAAASFQTLHEKADVLRSSAFLADFSHSLDDTPQWWTYSSEIEIEIQVTYIVKNQLGPKSIKIVKFILFIRRKYRIISS